MQYRSEVDGLRAVAIVPVVLFHAGFPGTSGGFVGVDVFFVISGYLITSLIVLESEAGHFSLIGFYERRARRILPPLFAMLFTSLPFAFLWMTPSELKSFGEGVAAVSIFLSNLLFYFHSGYFAPKALLNPLLHTWTLAVEEQYYVLFPLFLMALWRFGRRPIVAAVGLIAVLSFAFAHLGGSFNAHFPFIDRNWAFVPTSFGFFLTPARAWELMAGALIGLAIPGRAFPYSRTTEAAAAVGLGSIIYAIVTFNAQTPMPSVYTLIPVLGSALLIATATPKTLVGWLLGTRPFVGIGLISYSTYLWHQPLLAFTELHFGNGWWIAIPATLSFLAGYLSWRYLETPFRNRSQFTRKQIFAFSGIAMVTAISCGAYLTVSQGAVWRFSPADRYLVSFDPEDEGIYVAARFDNLELPFSDSDSRRRVLIVGDSFAKDVVNMLAENNLLEKYQFRTVNVPADCQITVPIRDTAMCRKKSPLQEEVQDRIRRADFVILAAAWSPEAASNLPYTIRALHLDPAKLLVVGTKSFGEIKPLAYVPLDHKARLALKNDVGQLRANVLLRNALPRDEFIDIASLICGADGRCPIFTPDEKLISFDGSHLTPEGALWGGRTLIGSSQFLRRLSNKH